MASRRRCACRVAVCRLPSQASAGADESAKQPNSIELSGIAQKLFSSRKHLNPALLNYYDPHTVYARVPGAKRNADHENRWNRRTSTGYTYRHTHLESSSWLYGNGGPPEARFGFGLEVVARWNGVYSEVAAEIGTILGERFWKLLGFLRRIIGYR